jgi:hypothetical protein
MGEHEDRFDDSQISPEVREALKKQRPEIREGVRHVADGGGNQREGGSGRPAVGTPVRRAGR